MPAVKNMGILFIRAVDISHPRILTFDSKKFKMAADAWFDLMHRSSMADWMP